MPQKQGAVNQQGQWERAVAAQNRGSVVLFWVPTLKEAVPPPPPPHPPGGRGSGQRHFSPGPALENSGGETDTGDNTADTPKGGRRTIRIMRVLI